MATIQGVYVALFGRPADPTGLAYFNSVTNNGANLNAIGNLATQSEYTARFTGLNNIQIINSIYQSLFNRDADLTGLTFFSDALAKGTLNINNVAIAILDGAQGNDKTIVTNKVAAADLYTKALDTGPEVVAYSGLAAAAQGVAFLKTVTTTVPTAAAVDTAVAAMVTTSQGGGTGATGVTLTLTAGGDTLGPSVATDASKTTANNDTIRGVAAGDLKSVDSIDGGAGTDTLNAVMSLSGANNAETTVKPVLKSVENVNLTYGALGAALTFDATDSSGIQKIVASAIAIDDATNTFTITGLEKTAVAELKGITVSDDAKQNPASIVGAAAITFKDTAGAADSATISLNKTTFGTGDSLKVTVAGIETLTINSTGSDANAADYNKIAISDAAASKIVITGDRDLTLAQGTTTANNTTTNDNTALKTVDASALTGKLTYTATANGETILGGTKGDAIALGNGVDTIVYNAANKSTVANLDVISGFNASATDKIDLKAFGLNATTTTVAQYSANNTALNGDFTGFFNGNSGNDKVIFQSLGNNNFMVYVNVDGNNDFNAGTDVAISLTGVTGTIDKTDFIFA